MANASVNLSDVTKADEHRVYRLLTSIFLSNKYLESREYRGLGEASVKIHVSLLSRCIKILWLKQAPQLVACGG
jgi:hypothetical protein